VSVGVSYNKIFAKLGSDIKKPDATTEITEDNFRDIVWKLPAGDLLGVGRATQIQLMKYSIRTIGDLANCNPDRLKSWFGKWGLFLWTYANGYDLSPVTERGDEAVVKSVGNSTTCPRDLENENDCHIVLQNLSESVAERMRELGLKAKTVEISLRRNDLFSYTRQMTLSEPTFISTEICAAAMKLLKKHYRWELPLRSIGVRGTNLIPASWPRQLDIFTNGQNQEKLERLERAIDDIRRRFGHHSINRMMMFADPLLGKLNPKSDHIIHPI